MKKPSHPVSFRRADYSLLQSAIAHVARKRARQRRGQIDFLATEEPMMQSFLKATQAPKVRKPVKGRAAELPLEECAKWAMEYMKAIIQRDYRKAAKIRADRRFTPCDIAGWHETLKVWEDYYEIRRCKPMYKQWRNLTDYVYPLPKTGRNGKNLVIGVLGDWGTGMPSAITVLQEMMKFQPDLILHLGDIYYSGTLEECKHNFLDVIRHYAPETPIYTIPGNHEYFSGGAGYYSVISELNVPIKLKWPVQEASFFCLQNEWLQIQAMDTGWGAHDFKHEQSEAAPALELKEQEWHKYQIQQGVKNNRRIILLSHHQAWSAFEHVDMHEKTPVNKHLLDTFAEPLKNGHITAWLWGHWHVLEAYKSPIQLPHPVKKVNVLGRCVGHGAFPVLKSTNPYHVHNHELEKYVDPGIGTTGVSKEGMVYNHGYAVLTLSPTLGEAAYCEVDGGTAEPIPGVKKETLYRAARRAARA